MALTQVTSDVLTSNLSFSGSSTFSGNVSVNTSNIPSNKDTVTPKFIVNGAGVAGSMQIVRNTTVGAGGAILELTATRGTDVNSYTILQSGDGIGSVAFGGSDGTQFVRAASVSAQVDAATGANDMPGRLIFATTADGASADTERMRIDSAGNVGIGTTTAGQKLTIANGNVNLSKAYGVYWSDSNVQIRTDDSPAWLALSNTMTFKTYCGGGTGAFVFHDSNTATNIMTIRGDTFNVGIGTSSPSSTLHVKADNASAKVEGNNSTNSTQFIVKNTTSNFYMALDNSSGGSFGKANAAVLWMDSANPMVFATNNSEKMRIDTSGNVGIGVTSIGSRLQVSGSANMAYFYDGSTSDFQIQAVSSRTEIGSTTSTPLSFKTANTERMRIDSAGNVLVGTTSAATPSTTGYVSSANTFGFKNRIINGAMVIDQRYAGGAISAATLGSGGYTLDRWKFQGQQSAKFSAQQNAGSVAVLATTGFANYLGFTSVSAYSIASTDYFRVMQPVEGFNGADMQWGTASAKTITISFWVYSSITGTYGVCLQNNDNNRGYVGSYTINSANTWEQKSVTIAGDTSGTWKTDNNIFAQVAFYFGAGSSQQTTPGSWSASINLAPTGQANVSGTNGATFYITGVQLEKGSIATSFDYRPYGTELALCQRYYQVAPVLYGAAISTTKLGVGYNYPVVMRSSPTAALLTSTPYAEWPDNTAFTASGATMNGTYAVGGAEFRVSGFSGMTAGRAPMWFQTNQISLSAEL